MILSIIFSLFFWQIGSSPKQPDKEQAHLKGDVNYISVQQAAQINEAGKIVEGRRENVSVTVYDPQGRMKEYTYNPNARSAIKRAFTYDAEGKREEKFARYKIADENEEKEELVSEPRTFKTIFKFDAEGRRSEENKYSEDGKLVEKRVYRYTINNATEVTVLGAGDSFLSRCVDFYDAKDRTSERICYNAQGGVLAKETYNYESRDFDNQGNWLKRTETLSQISDGKLVIIGNIITYRSLTYFSPTPPIAKTETNKPTAQPLAEPPKPKAEPAAPADEPVIAAKPIHRVDPVYPSFARSLNLSGSVVVELTIDERGKVIKAEAVNGPAPLRQAAIDAAKQWEFQPATQNGKPVQNISRITFNFTR